MPRRGTRVSEAARQEIQAFVEENPDLLARILRSGSPEAQGMALALLANVEPAGPLEAVRRHLDELIEERRNQGDA